jgi:hypothetical protein
MAGLVGIAALARLLAARRAATTAPAPRPAPAQPDGDPAEALRRKLSETRGAAGTDATPPAVGSASEPTETLDERRARAHAKAQEAMEAMEALQEPPT